MRLKDKRAIVTGSADGIGRAIADGLSKEGAKVMLVDVKPDVTTALLPGQVYERADVSNPDDWARLADRAVTLWGGVDCLVNNAAIISYQSVHEIVLEDWNRSIAVNQTGPMLGMRSVIPLMRKQGGGSIINVTSSWAIVAAEGVAAYHATKGALRMLTKNAAITYAKDKIRVNAIVPGIVRTPLTDAQPEVTAHVVSKTPLGLSEPHEIAAGAVFLASDEASAVTGADFMMDGGYTVT
jgi:NAD(P)-dependent dehydrogenase (short-subunit alcohol dehydrogenase family)